MGGAASSANVQVDNSANSVAASGSVKGGSGGDAVAEGGSATAVNQTVVRQVNRATGAGTVQVNESKISVGSSQATVGAVIVKGDSGGSVGVGSVGVGAGSVPIAVPGAGAGGAANGAAATETVTANEASSGVLKASRSPLGNPLAATQPQASALAKTDITRPAADLPGQPFATGALESEAQDVVAGHDEGSVLSGRWETGANQLASSPLQPSAPHAAALAKLFAPRFFSGFDWPVIRLGADRGTPLAGLDQLLPGSIPSISAAAYSPSDTAKGAPAGKTVVVANEGTGGGVVPGLPGAPIPAPAPAAPAASSSASGGNGGPSNFIPLAALMALFALSPPAISRRLKGVGGIRPPVPFLCALERPG